MRAFPIIIRKEIFQPWGKILFLSFEFRNFDFPLVTILDNWWFNPYLFCHDGQLFQLTECELGRMIFLLRNLYHYIKIEKTTIRLFSKNKPKVDFLYYICLILLLSITGAFFLNLLPVVHFFLQKWPSSEFEFETPALNFTEALNWELQSLAWIRV